MIKWAYNAGRVAYSAGPLAYNAGPVVHNTAPVVHNSGPVEHNTVPVVYNTAPPLLAAGPQRRALSVWAAGRGWRASAVILFGSHIARRAALGHAIGIWTAARARPTS